MAARALVLAAVLGSAASADAAPRIAISGPDRAVGDGATAVTLVVTGAPGKADAIRVDATAGSIASIVAHGDAVRISYIPPRVAVDTTATVSATLAGASATARLAIATPVELAPPPLASGPLALRVPARLVLGRDGPVGLTAAAPPGTGVTFVASTGTLGAPTVDAGGAIRVAYTPPPSRAPTRAVIGAVTDDGRLAEVGVIALYGVGKVDAVTRARLYVTVQVGDELFGPVRADARGRASLAVLVAPGIVAATASAVGGRDTILPLGDQPAHRIAAACLADRVFAFAIDDAGRPLATGEPAIAIAPGTGGPVERLAPGVFATRVAPPPDAAPGAKLGVTVTAPDASSIARCEATIAGEEPTAWTVEVVPTALRAGDPATVTATPRYAGRAPRIVITPTLEVDRGALAAPETAPDGTVTARWTVERFEGSTTATATVRAGARVAAGRIALVAGPIARIALQAPGGRLVADGRTTTRLAVRAWDRFDNPAPTAALTFAARGQAMQRGDAVQYRPVLGFEALADEIVATDPASGTTGAAVIRLAAARRTLAAGLRAGYTTNLGAVGAPAIVIDGGLRLGLARRRIVIGVELGWFADAPAVGASEPVEIGVSAVSTRARATYGIELGRTSLYGGLAAGVAFTRVKTMSASTGRYVERATVPSVAGIAGAELALGPGRAVLEAGYGRVGVDGDVVRGDLGGFQVTAGYRLER